jgi:predicted ferric reductase
VRLPVAGCLSHRFLGLLSLDACDGLAGSTPVTALKHESVRSASSPTRRRPPAAASALPPRPAPSPVVPFDIAWLTLLNVAVVAAMWIVHGGLERLVGWGGWLTGIGQLAALYGTMAILADLVLISRIPWLERRYGMDRLNLWHRWAGFAAVTLLVLHALATTLGYAATAAIGLWSQITDFFLNYPDVFASMVGLGVLITVAITSIRAARRRLSYETWWFIHLYAYIAVALSFAHQFAVGTDFLSDWWARAYWAVLYLLVAGLLVGHRWVVPILRALRHRLRVVNVEREVPGVATIVIAGRRLDRLPAEAGQFFLLRFLTRDRWWKAMPLSLSAPPNGRTLRFTVKALGDDTAALQRIRVGTPVMAEGPYGAFTGALATRRKVLLIAGGIGITPLRSLYEDLDRRPGEVALLYRTRSKEEAVFLDDLTRISKQRGFDLYVSYSRPMGRSIGGDPFAPRRLLEVVPDLARRDVFVCGSTGVVAAARSGLMHAGVPARQIHLEKFAY